MLGVLFFARTAMAFQFQAVASVSPLLMRDLAIDFALLGALIGAWMLPGVVAAIPGGLLGRRFGDKKVVIAGLALMAAGSFLTAGAASYPVAMLGRVIAGAGAVVLNVLLTKMVADWFHDRHLASATAILIVSWPFGVGLALVILGPLAVGASWNFAVQVTAWVCIVALLAVLFAYRTPPRSGAAPHSPSSLSRRDLAVALAAGLIWTFYNAAYILVVSFTPALLTARGAALSNAALLASFATWPLIVSVPLGGYLADRTGRGQDIMVASLLGMALTMPAVLLVPAPLAALAVFGLVGGLAGGIIAALPGQALSSQARHLGLGIFFTLYYVGMALLPALAGWLRDRFEYDAAPFAFGSLLAILAAGLGFAFRRVARPA